MIHEKECKTQTHDWIVNHCASERTCLIPSVNWICQVDEIPASPVAVPVNELSGRLQFVRPPNWETVQELARYRFLSVRSWRFSLLVSDYKVFPARLDDTFTFHTRKHRTRINRSRAPNRRHQTNMHQHLVSPSSKSERTGVHPLREYSCSIKTSGL